jgi:hypothetical protein
MALTAEPRMEHFNGMHSKFGGGREQGSSPRKHAIVTGRRGSRPGALAGDVLEFKARAQDSRLRLPRMQSSSTCLGRITKDAVQSKPAIANSSTQRTRAAGLLLSGEVALRAARRGAGISAAAVEIAGWQGAGGTSHADLGAPGRAVADCRPTEYLGRGEDQGNVITAVHLTAVELFP